MLILSRKLDESIIIGDDEIKITVLEIQGSQIRLGIEAPKDISIHREEIYHRIKNGEPRKPKIIENKGEKK